MELSPHRQPPHCQPQQRKMHGDASVARRRRSASERANTRTIDGSSLKVRVAARSSQTVIIDPFK
jgi:hypothetical protein